MFIIIGVFFTDNGEEVWGGGEEEGHEDHHGAWPEGDGPAGDAGEGGGPGLLRHQQEHRRPHTDVPAGLHHQAGAHAAAMRSKLKHGHHDEGANIQQSWCLSVVML